MVIKNVNLETVCGITSTLPENQHPEVAFPVSPKCRQILDQRSDEQKSLCKSFPAAGQDPDHQLLQCE